MPSLRQGGGPSWSHPDTLNQKPKSVQGDGGREGPLRGDWQLQAWRSFPAPTRFLLWAHPCSRHTLCAHTLLLLPVPRTAPGPVLTHILGLEFGEHPFCEGRPEKQKVSYLSSHSNLTLQSLHKEGGCVGCEITGRLRRVSVENS